MPRPNSSLDPLPNASMDPGYDAIVLDTAPPSASNNNGQRQLTWFESRMQGVPFIPGPPTQSLRFGPRPEPSQPTQTRRSRLESYVRGRRDVNPNDPSTTLGRRIAARLTSAEDFQGPEATTVVINSSITEEMSSRILEIASTLQRDLRAEHRSLVQAMAARSPPEAGLATAGQSEPPSTTPVGSGSGRAQDNNRLAAAQWRYTRAARDSRFRGGLTNGRRPQSGDQPPNPSPSRPRDRAPTAILGTSIATPQATAQETDSVRDSAVPRHRTRRRLSEVDRTLNGVTDDSSETDDPFSWFLPRAAPVNVAPDASTAIQNTASDLASDFAAQEWGRDIIRGQLQQLRETRIALSNASPRRRRRGWARLDQDGNEIPTDEEEEYERNRAQMRARSIALTSQSSSQRAETRMPPPPPSEPQLSSFAVMALNRQMSINDNAGPPSTAESLDSVPLSLRRLDPTFDTAPEWERRSPLPAQRRHDPDATDERTPSTRLPERLGTESPLTPSPLPLPLVDLDSNARSAKSFPNPTTAVRMIKVHAQADFAGR